MRILIAAPPKAGNMWLKCLLSSIYNLGWLRPHEQPERSDLASFRDWVAAGNFRDNAIFHQHYDYSDELCEIARSVPAHLVSIVRDPYDAFVSTYFTLQQHAAEDSKRGRRVSRLAGKPIDDPEVLAFLAEGGYENNLTKANAWLHSGDAVVLRYEALQEDAAAELKRATDRIAPVAPERIERAIERCKADNMRQMSGGMAKHVRSATVGDWRNHLTEAHLAVFRDRYGELIRSLGYPVR